MDAKQITSIRADHLLSITVTKTMLNLALRLTTMFQDAYNKGLPLDDDEENESLLSVLNMTGHDIYIDDIEGVQV